VQDRHAREQRALDAISHELTDSDPGLAGRLGTFNRLVSAEEMPGRERILPAPRPAPGKRRRPCRRLPLAWIAMLVWLLIAIALLAIALLLRHSASVGSGSAHARAVTTAISAISAISM
jgi:hypothetical protein